MRNLGDEFASNLVTSYPILARRDLGNSFGGMLRPSAKEWFHIGTNQPKREDTEAKQWLESTAGFMRRVMYDRRSQFSRATKEGDHDFAAFGQCVISVELNKALDGLLYRCWHLRDCAWVEDGEGRVGELHRRWKPTVTELRTLFPGKVHDKVDKLYEKNPFAEVNVRHVCMPIEDYEGLPGAKKLRSPYVSVYMDCDHDHIMEEVGSGNSVYVVPRWQTVSGSQYAHSPATVAALPDGRLIQAISAVLLEAGEKAVTPPMIAVREAIRADLAVYAGGVTWVDAEYDERLGEVLRPLTQDKSGVGFGMDFVQDLRQQLADAFYLSKLNLPPAQGPDMTAYEVGQRVQEFIRNALPLFEPLEADYNGQLCELTLDILLRNVPEIRGSVPRSIQGMEIQFTFESPLRDALEKMKLGKFMEAQQVLATAAQLDPSVVHLIDGRKATRDVLGAVAPADWMRTEVEVEERLMVEQQAMEQQQQMAAMQQGAETAKTLSEVQKNAPGMM